MALNSAEIPGFASSSGCGVLMVRPGAVFVVDSSGFEAAVEDADEAVGEPAQGGVVADVTAAHRGVVGAGAGRNTVTGMFCGIEWAEGHHDTAVVDARRSLLARRRVTDGLPRLGRLTGARVLAEISNDRRRFTDPRTLKAYAGTAPIIRASGAGRIGMANAATATSCRSTPMACPDPLATVARSSVRQQHSGEVRDSRLRCDRKLLAGPRLRELRSVGRVASEAKPGSTSTPVISAGDDRRRCRRPRRSRFVMLTSIPQSAGPQRRGYLDAAPPSELRGREFGFAGRVGAVGRYVAWSVRVAGDELDRST